MELEHNRARMKISTGVYRPQPSGQIPLTAFPDGLGTIFRWLRESQRIPHNTWKDGTHISASMNTMFGALPHPLAGLSVLPRLGAEWL